MRERLQYAAAWATLKFLGWLPRPVSRWTAARFAAIVFRIRPVWRRMATFNLRLAFPEWSEAERSRVVRLMVRNLGWLMAEFAHLPDYSRENIERTMVQDGFENYLAAERRGRGVLFLTGHLGAWELKPFAHALYHKPIYFLVRPIKNPRVNALVNRYRGLCGNRPIEKNESARMVLRVLRDGGTVGVLADQNTTPAEAVFVNFFGLPAATTAGLARMARHTGAAVVPVHSYWDAQLKKYRLRYEPALQLAQSADEEADVRAHTELFNKMLEGIIRRFPDQWFWVHRRWKNRPPGEEPIYSDEKAG
jgi:KDO2-lipid IV(A) lauroyltransferase